MTHESAPVDSGARERLLLRFRILDSDGNGHLDAADFDRLATRVLTALGEPRGSVKGQAVLDGRPYSRNWTKQAKAGFASAVGPPRSWTGTAPSAPTSPAISSSRRPTPD